MVVFSYFESNCLHQCFAQLGGLSPNSCTGPNDAQRVPKSTLAVLCLNVGDALDVRFNEKCLKEYEKEKNDLSFAEFVLYIEADLLGEIAHVDLARFRAVLWDKVFAREARDRSTSIFSLDDLRKIWFIFNRLDDEQRLALDVGEADALLRKFAEALGMKRAKCDDADDDDRNRVAFWDLVVAMERDYAHDVEASVYVEVLDDLLDEIVRDVVKKGYMTKKGHARHTWKERWFVLDMTSLTYYVSRERMEKKGCVRLTDRSIVEPIAEKTQHKYRLLLTDGVDGRKYELCASDQRTKQEWLASLRRVISHRPEKGSIRRQEMQERRRVREERRMEMQRIQETNEQQRRELERERQAREEAETRVRQEQEWLQEEMQRRLEAEVQQRKHLEELERERALKMEEEREKKVKGIPDTKIEFELFIYVFSQSKEELLGEELRRRQELEGLHEQQRQELEDEKRKLDEMQQQNEEFMRLLQLEREKYEKAEEERRRAEELYKQALARGENPPKPPKYEVKISPGLARLIGPKGGLVTHRGMGAFPKDSIPDPLWEERKLSKSPAISSVSSQSSTSEPRPDVENVEIRKAEEEENGSTVVADAAAGHDESL